MAALKTAVAGAVLRAAAAHFAPGFDSATAPAVARLQTGCC
jgi:hypothetical protein